MVLAGTPPRPVRAGDTVPGAPGLVPAARHLRPGLGRVPGYHPDRGSPGRGGDGRRGRGPPDPVSLPADPRREQPVQPRRGSWPVQRPRDKPDFPSAAGEVGRIDAALEALRALPSGFANPQTFFNQQVELVGSLDGLYFNQDRVIITSGRRADPARPGQVVISELTARRFGLRVGQSLAVNLYSPQQASDPRFNPLTGPPPPRPAHGHRHWRVHRRSRPG